MQIIIVLNVCKRPLDRFKVSQACIALKVYSDERREVRQLISVLTWKIEASQDRFNAQAVGNALYGLQGMSSECVEVRALLSVLRCKVAECSQPLNAQEVGNALYGLSKCSLDESWLTFLQSCFATLSQLDLNSSLEDVRTSYQTLCLLEGTTLSAITTSERHATKDKLLQLLTNQVEESNLCGIAGSRSEARYVRLAQAVVHKNPGLQVQVAHNEYLFGFEADLVFRCQRTNRVLNLELDGPHHRRSKTQRFGQARDEYLTREHGVAVERWSLVDLENTKGVEAKLKKLISKQTSKT